MRFFLEVEAYTLRFHLIPRVHHRISINFKRPPYDLATSACHLVSMSSRQHVEPIAFPESTLAFVVISTVHITIAPT